MMKQKQAIDIEIFVKSSSNEDVWLIYYNSKIDNLFDLSKIVTAI